MKTWIVGLWLTGSVMLASNASVQAQADYGVYSKSVASFKDYITRFLPRGAAKGYDDSIYLSTYDYKQWTEEDLRKLATARNGIAFFVSLEYMKNSAAVQDAMGNYTISARQAQNALSELKPDCCKNWKSFFNMIIRVESSTERERSILMKRDNIRVPGGT